MRVPGALRRGLLRLGAAAPLLSTAPTLFLAAFLAAKGLLAVFAAATLGPPVVLELAPANPLPRLQRFVLALLVVGLNGYLHFRGGRRAVVLSLVPTLLSLAGLAWGSAAAGGRLDGEALGRTALFATLALVAVADHGRLLGAPGGAGPAPPPVGATAPGGPGGLPLPAAGPSLAAALLGAAVPPITHEASVEELIDALDAVLEGGELPAPPALPRPGPPAPPAPPGADWASLLPNPQAPIACPVCNTVNPPRRETCAFCDYPLLLSGETYFNCPECGVLIPQRVGRCFACGQAFHVLRIEAEAEMPLHFLTLEAMPEIGNVPFVHFDPEAGTLTYLLATADTYELITLVLRRPPGPDLGLLDE